MANQTGIAIVIKAFLPTGKKLDEQFEALSVVKAAHETGDYSELLKAATIDEVKTESKTRRVPDQPKPIEDDPKPIKNLPDPTYEPETLGWEEVPEPVASARGGRQR